MSTCSIAYIERSVVTVRSEFDPRVLQRCINISFLHLYSSIVFDGAFGTVKKWVNKYKNHLKGDIGMANYEKQVEQEAAYPIPISLYNCYRTVRHEKRGIATPNIQCFSCLTVL